MSMYPSWFASRAKQNIPHECLPVHRHLSYVYCMSVWNMSWYVNVFLVQSHNNLDITCALISYISHTCIYIYIDVYTYVCIMSNNPYNEACPFTHNSLMVHHYVFHLARSIWLVFSNMVLHKCHCMTSHPSIFWTQSDTIKFHDFGLL